MPGTVLGCGVLLPRLLPCISPSTQSCQFSLGDSPSSVLPPFHPGCCPLHPWPLQQVFWISSITSSRSLLRTPGQGESLGTMALITDHKTPCLRTPLWRTVQLFTGHVSHSLATQFSVNTLASWVVVLFGIVLLGLLYLFYESIY